MRASSLLSAVKSAVFSVSLVMSFPLMSQCIGVVTAGGGDGFWGEVKKGAEAAGKELSLKVLVRGAADEVDSKSQAKIIHSMMEMGCEALVLAPNNADRNKDVKSLKEKGISTVFIDRDTGGERVSVIKTDNFKAGYLAGLEMANALADSTQKRVVLLRMDQKVISTRLREEGFIKAAKEKGLGLIFDGYLGTTIGQARLNSIRFLKGLGEFEGVFTPNESTCVSVLASLKQLGLEQDVKFIGFDSHALMIKAVQERSMQGFIIQNPFLMGYQGVKTAHAARLGKTIDASVEAEVIFVDASNIKQKKIQEMLGLKN
ncbi:substrate-binding domain-containing protein [Marinomonas sp. S3726]|uniref:substrate-binding domain-containing protein n=1 Tax=Marinomonas sp. S3726 TaxID=579484 RepID=UPI0006962053|nr:substrate-binding domain-containing protein [Marinomonas sp. S3726]